MGALQDFREQYPQYNDLDDEQLADSLYQRYYSDMDQATYRESMGLAPPPEPEKPPTVWERVKSKFTADENKPDKILNKDAGVLEEFALELDDDPVVRRGRGYVSSGDSPTPNPNAMRFGRGRYPSSDQDPELEDPELPRANLRDQLFAGFDEYRSNRANMETLEAGEVALNAELLAKGQAWPRLDADSGPAPLAIKPQYNEQELQADIERIENEWKGKMQSSIDRRKELADRAAQIPYHKETTDMLKAETFAEGLNEFADDPIMIVAETSLRSLPNMAEALPLAIAGSLTAGPIGFASGMGYGAGMTEYRASFSQYLQDNGVDWNSADSIFEALKDDSLMREAHSFAGKRSGIIGGTSMVGAGVSTQMLAPAVKSQVARELINVGAQTGIQTTLEGGGEAVAQLATEGEIAPGDVLAEMTGSLAQTPIEVGAATVTGVRSDRMQQQVIDIENQVRKVIGDAPDPETTEADDTTVINPDLPPETPEAEKQVLGPRGAMDDLANQETRDNYLVRFKQTEAERINIGLDTIESPEDAAHVFSFLRKRGQEAFYMLVLDDQGTPINLIRQGEGLKASVPADPTTIIGAIANTPGAATVYYSHNHPSENPKPSQGDINITKLLNEQLRDTGIKFGGHVIVGPADATATLLDANTNPSQIQITPARRDKRMTITTRNARKRSGEERPQLSEPAKSIRFAKGLDTKNGIVFLDNQLRPTAIKPLEPEEMMNLRQEDRVRKIMASVDASNASSAMLITTESQAAKNLSKMLGKMKLSVTDAIIWDGNQVRSDRSGLDDIRGARGTFSSRVPRETTIEERQAEADDQRRQKRERRVLASRQPAQVDFEVGPADTAAVDIDTQVQDQAPAVDRRQQRRERVQRMSLDEQVDAQYTDAMTGLGNRKAFEEEVGDHAFVASIDADSLKWINDNLGHDAGDAMLVAIAEAINQPEIDAYRLGGDEFYIGGPDKESVQAALDLATGVLANQLLESPNGSKKGIEMTGAIGTDKASADSRMEVEKKRKKGRAERGAQPPGVTLNSKTPAKVLDMQPGTNYVPMIGKRGDLPIDADNNLIMGTTGKPVRIPKKPIRREHILAIMRKYFGNRIYQGRVKGKLRLGFYRPGHGEVRIKTHNDIEVAAHEIAHFLDDRYPWIAELYKFYPDEVKSVSYDKNLIFEGWAEFMRLWMTQESAAMQRTPSFYDAFNKAAQKKDPRLWNMLVDLQELMHAWTMQGARARAASKHSDQGPSFAEQIRQLFPHNITQRTLDGLRSVKSIAADLSGYASQEVQTAYDKLRLAVGGANGVLEATMFYGTPKYRDDGQGIELGGESLQAVFGDSWGDNEVAMYMIARRAEELAGQGRENLMRPDEIAAALSIEADRPEVRDMFDKYQEFNSRILDFAEAGGILGPENRAAIEEMNQNYVPFNRVIESQTTGDQVRNGGNPFQRLSGGTQNINNIWDNIVNNTGMIIRMAMINDGKRQLFRQLTGTSALGSGERNQQAGVYAAPIDKEVKPTSVDSDQVLRKAVEAMGISWREYRMADQTGMVPPGPQGDFIIAMVPVIKQMAQGLDSFTQFWQYGQDPKGNNVDHYMHQGQKFFFEINDPDLMDTLKFLGPKGTNLAIGILGGFSATLRRGVVAVPVFQIKNFARDTVNSWMLSDHVKVPAVRAMRVVMSRMGKDPAYHEMLLNGGGFANRSQGLQAQRKVIVDPTRLAAFYDRFMGRFENANRLAEYKAARAAGESPRRAALLSREISTDFAMRGSSEVARFLAISVPFLNARAQGLYRVGRQFDTRQRVLSYATRGLMLAGATMALYALNKDDERYKELPEDIKDLYWVFFTGDQEDDYVLFPKPFESGMIFATLPERMFEFAEQQNGKEFADALGWMMLSTFSMDMTPQAFQPELDLQRNKNFTGAPIIPHYLENVEPTEQYTYYTSETVRAAAQAAGISPIKMEYRLRGYLGTLGTYGIGAADAMMRAATDPEDRQFGEDPTRGETWRENILVRALVDPLVNEGPPRRTKYVTDFYDMMRETEKVANTAALLEKRSVEDLEAYLEDPEAMALYVTNPALQNGRAALNQVRKAMDAIRQDPDMDGDEKRVQLWDLTRQRNSLAREIVLDVQQAQATAEEQLANAQ